MAKYNITHTCGHSETVQIYGKMDLRAGQAEWMESKDCWDCVQTARAAARDAENKQSAQIAESMGLPALAGTEKQIAWAETIRATALANPRNSIVLPPLTPERVANTVAKFPGLTVERIQEGRVAIEAAMIAARAKMEAETSAKWWIDSRDDQYTPVQMARAKSAAAYYAAEQMQRIEAEEQARMQREAEAAAKREADAAEIAAREQDKATQRNLSRQLLGGAGIADVTCDDHGNVKITLTSGAECQGYLTKYAEAAVYSVGGYDTKPDDTRDIEAQLVRWAQRVGWGGGVFGTAQEVAA